MITTEQLVTSPVGFNLATATPVQRAACRARDGLPLRELAEDIEVQRAFGGAEAIGQLPSERGIKPVEFYNVASARTFKTGLACASAIRDCDAVDVSDLGHGEIARISIVSLKLDVADVPYRRTLDTIKASPVLAPLLMDATADTLTIRHPSGKLIEIAVVAGGRAASGLVARWCAGAIFDEAPRMTGREDGVVNLSDALSAVRERLLPGAQIQCIGSPWAPHGPVYDIVQQYFGKPTDDIVVMRTTGPAGNPRYWTPERLERLRLKDEIAWRINELGEFIDPESGLLSPIAVRKSSRDGQLELLPEDGEYYAAHADTSDGSPGGNPFALVIVKAFVADDNELAYAVALAREWRGLRPELAWREIAQCCRMYGIEAVDVDQHAAGANADLARQQGLALNKVSWTQASKLEAFTDMAVLIHSDRVELSPERTFRSDLLAVKKRATQNGFVIHLPRTSNGRHCDFAPALAGALRAGRAAVCAANNSDSSDWFNSQRTHEHTANFGNRSAAAWG